MFRLVVVSHLLFQPFMFLAALIKSRNLHPRSFARLTSPLPNMTLAFYFYRERRRVQHSLASATRIELCVPYGIIRYSNLFLSVVRQFFRFLFSNICFKSIF